MRKFISMYENPNVGRINYGIINREHDAPLVDHVVDVCKSLSVVEQIDYIDHEFITDEKEIDINYYYKSRKSKKKKEKERYMLIHDSRCGELRVRFRLSCQGQEKVLEKRFLIPLKDSNGYFTIKGNRYFLIYQLVDSSTYSKGQTLTLKSLMPVKVTSVKDEIKDTDGNFHTGFKYTILIFTKSINILYFYFAQLGVKATFNYFNVGEVMDIVDKEYDKENNYYFLINSKMYLQVNRRFFDDYEYVRSMVTCTLDIFTNRLTFEDLNDNDFWIERLGALSATKAYAFREKGLNSLTHFERMLDETTKKVLKVHPQNRDSMYSIVRWLVQNFNELRRKDDMDLKNKRLRCNEYIASLLTQEFSNRINRVITQGKKVKMRSIEDVFKMSGDVILQKLHRSGLLRFDDRVNDMDAFSKLKITQKGPNSLGNKNSRSMSAKHRGIHPSHLGRLDINVCGTSDPGSSGVLTFFVETDGLYFDKNYETEDSTLQMEKNIEEYQKLNEDMEYVITLLDGVETIEERAMYEERIRNVNRSFKVYLKNN